MNKLKALYKEYPFRSAKKFIPIAIEHGFSKGEANKFLASLPRDIKYTNQSELMLPIYGKQQGCYQFDTLIQTKSASPRYFLIIININSRKLYAYPMDNKNADTVYNILSKFINTVKDVSSFTSDQDHSYVTPIITNLFLKHHIDHSNYFS